MQIEIADILNFIYLIYNALRKGIQLILEETIIKASPKLAEKYADALSLLITITAIWLIIEFSTSLRNIVKAVVIFGWILLFISIFVSII